MLTAALTSPATSSRSFTAPSETRNVPETSDGSNNNRNTLGSAPCHLRIVPHLDSTRSLVFGIIERDVTDDTLLKIGRFTDKYISPTRITFKSKVVSRGHAEIWAKNGKVSEVIRRKRYHTIKSCLFQSTGKEKVIGVMMHELTYYHVVLYPWYQIIVRHLPQSRSSVSSQSRIKALLIDRWWCSTIRRRLSRRHWR